MDSNNFDFDFRIPLEIMNFPDDDYGMDQPMAGGQDLVRKTFLGQNVQGGDWQCYLKL